ncbi:hypothetical protein A9Z61_11240 [Moraxella osloensis]|nr:hypothetical protein [Moraxella osloensis]OBX56721.1 hypothetical protein A9Z61_11240 [Moraxella osloensis]
MTAAHPSDPTAPSYADLLAQDARLQQQLDAQKQHYQQQAAQLKQQYQQQMDAQRQQYEAKLARINQELTDAIRDGSILTQGFIQEPLHERFNRSFA